MLDHWIPDRVLAALAGENVCYRPGLSGEAWSRRAAELARVRPDVLITRMAPDETEVWGWRAAAEDDPLVVITIGLDRVAARAQHGLIQDCVDENTDDVYPRAFALAERRWSSAVTMPALTTRLARSAGRQGREVAMVGAGVVNLLTALTLTRDGYRVTVYDRAPDPRGSAHWTAFGCTRGGGDARMVTLTEADGYYRAPDTGVVPFRVPVAETGWRIARPGSLTERELDWVRDNADVPPWLAGSYTQDVLGFNRAAWELWRELADQEPQLFDGAGLREGILRLYTDPRRFVEQVRRQERVGALRRVLAPLEIAERYPALAEAARAGVFAGGIETLGFTVQVHAFLANLVELLEAAGVDLHWEQPAVVAPIERRPAAAVGQRPVAAERPATADGPIRADHVVLSPGAYGGDLLRGTASHGMIHGVLGVWVSVPNPAPALTNSLKLHRTGHIAEDANITVTGDGGAELAIGSGYGWTGADPSNLDADALEVMYEAVEDTAARLFPAAFDDARRSGLLERSRRYCVRPWTASSLPILEVAELDRAGLLVVTGGHNTGGFAQAPVVAEAVAATLGGRPHAMHALYHPDRLRLFYRRRAPRGWAAHG